MASFGDLGVRRQWPSRRDNHCVPWLGIVSAPSPCGDSHWSGPGVRDASQIISRSFVADAIQTLELEAAFDVRNRNCCCVFAVSGSWSARSARLSVWICARERHRKWGAIFSSQRDSKSPTWRSRSDCRLCYLRDRNSGRSRRLDAAATRRRRKLYRQLIGNSFSLHSFGSTTLSLVLRMANSAPMFHPFDPGFVFDALELFPLPDLALLVRHAGVQNKSVDVCAVLFHFGRDNLVACQAISRYVCG